MWKSEQHIQKPSRYPCEGQKHLFWCTCERIIVPSWKVSFMGRRSTVYIATEREAQRAKRGVGYCLMRACADTNVWKDILLTRNTNGRISLWELRVCIVSDHWIWFEKGKQVWQGRVSAAKRATHREWSDLHDDMQQTVHLQYWTKHQGKISSCNKAIDQLQKHAFWFFDCKKRHLFWRDSCQITLLQNQPASKLRIRVFSAVHSVLILES